MITLSVDNNPIFFIELSWLSNESSLMFSDFSSRPYNLVRFVSLVIIVIRLRKIWAEVVDEDIFVLEG